MFRRPSRRVTPCNRRRSRTSSRRRPCRARTLQGHRGNELSGLGATVRGAARGWLRRSLDFVKQADEGRKQLLPRTEACASPRVQMLDPAGEEPVCVSLSAVNCTTNAFQGGSVGGPFSTASGNAAWLELRAARNFMPHRMPEIGAEVWKAGGKCVETFIFRPCGAPLRGGDAPARRAALWPQPNRRWRATR